MSFSQLHKSACIVSLLISVVPANLHSEPTGFFPSVPIHEDDGVLGEYELRVVGCSFEISRYTPSRAAPRRILKTLFELSYYDTSLSRVNAPYPDSRLSSRHTVVWFTDGISDADLENVNIPLRDARLSFAERRNIDMVAAREKQARLRELLAEMEAGNFGAFAGQNHTVSYYVEGEGLELDGVWVARAFQLPVEREDAQQLINEMNTYRLQHCLER